METDLEKLSKKVEKVSEEPRYMCSNCGSIYELKLN